MFHNQGVFIQNDSLSTLKFGYVHTSWLCPSSDKVKLRNKSYSHSDIVFQRAWKLASYMFVVGWLSLSLFVFGRTEDMGSIMRHDNHYPHIQATTFYLAFLFIQKAN